MEPYISACFKSPSSNPFPIPISTPIAPSVSQRLADNFLIVIFVGVNLADPARGDLSRHLIEVGIRAWCSGRSCGEKDGRGPCSLHI